MRARPANGRLEKAEQALILKLCYAAGAVKHYTLGTVRKRGDYQGTMQTPGLADLQVFFPLQPTARGMRPLRLVMIEVKREKGGRFSDAQREYRDLLERAGIDYIGGNYDAVVTWLVEHGYLSRANLPHYRTEGK
jgi:hypothetical protein